MADNVFRVTTTAKMYGQTCQNVMHFSGPSTDPAQLSTLADDIQTNWINVWRLNISGDVQWVTIEVRLLSSQFAPFTKTISITGNSGTSNQLFPFVAYVVRLRAATFGRRSRGRVYFPGVPPGQINLGFWSTTVIANWTGACNNVLARFGPTGSSTFRLGIAPKTNTEANFKQVTQILLAPSPGVQRRRNIGIGI